MFPVHQLANNELLDSWGKVPPVKAVVAVRQGPVAVFQLLLKIQSFGHARPSGIHQGKTPALCAT